MVDKFFPFQLSYSSEPTVTLVELLGWFLE